MEKQKEVAGVSYVFKRAWSIFTWFLVAVVVLLAVLLVGVRLVGFKPYTVLSGSMEPTYHVGSMIYVRSVDPKELDVDDPVTFYLNGTTVATHRIIEVLPDEKDPDARYFRTQGDANDTPDSDPTHSSKIIGKPIFTIPYLGFLANFFQQPAGRVVAFVGCIVLILVFVLPDVMKNILDMAKPKEAKDTESSEKSEKSEN